MDPETKLEKRDMAEWLKFLETQISNRNSEIAMLRKELDEKISLLQELDVTIESDSSRLAEMTDALSSAASAIEVLKTRLHELEEQIGTATVERHALQKECDDLRGQLEVAQAREEELQRKAGKGHGAIPAFLVGTVAGVLAVNLLRLVLPGASAGEAEATLSRSGNGLELQARAALTPTPKSTPHLTLPSPSETAIAADTWLQTLSGIRKTLYGIDGSVAWDISPQFDTSAPVVAITRAQFRDVVTKGLPTALPTRQSDGVLLHELDPQDFDATELSRSMSQENVPHGSLCSPWNLEPANSRRLTIVFSNSATSLDCLNRAIASAWFQHAWEEVTLISISEEPKFAASYFAEKKFVSYQEWHPDWITTSTAGEDPEATPETVLRAKRLARVAKVLTKTSDVRIQVPIESRRIRTENGNVVLPERGNEATVSFGNFSLIPNTLATGPIRATRLSLQTGKLYGRSVMQSIAPNARAVIINGAEQ